MTGGAMPATCAHEPAAGQVNSFDAACFAFGSTFFQPAGISNFSGGTAEASIEIVSTVICAAWIMPAGSPLSVALLGGGAAASAFFLKRPLVSLLPKVLAAELKIELPAEFLAMFPAAAPAAEPAAPAADAAAASPAAWLASVTALPPPPGGCFFALAQCSPPKAMRTTVFSG